jgi:hypothetical protein
MIYHHLGALVLEAQGDEARAVLRRWLRSDTGTQCDACE